LVQDGNCKKWLERILVLVRTAFYNITNKNSSADEIANVNFYEVRPKVPI